MRLKPIRGTEQKPVRSMCVCQKGLEGVRGPKYGHRRSSSSVVVVAFFGEGEGAGGLGGGGEATGEDFFRFVRPPSPV